MNREARIAKLVGLIRQAAGTSEYDQWENEQNELSDQAFRDLLRGIGRALMPWIATMVDSPKTKCALKLQDIIIEELKKFDK